MKIKNKTIKMCTERSVLVDTVSNDLQKLTLKTFSKLHRKVPLLNTMINVQPIYLALLKANKWNVRKKIRVKFLNGHPTVKRKIKEFAKIWEQHVNIKFNFVSSGYAEIRIGIKWHNDKGSWSYMGTDALYTTNQKKPTMNFGWFDQYTDDVEYSSTVLHEFGHALGCIHEHQNPKISIPWDKKAVYRYYAGSPNFWDKKKVNSNIFEKYSYDITNFSKPDVKSIMLYSISKDLTGGRLEVGWNTKLSKMDKKFISKMYPF